MPRLDLPYEEDVRAETDMNVVMTGDGAFVEVQGTAEGAPFDRAELDALLDLAEKGCADLTRLQREALAAMTHARSSSASRNAKKLAELRRILAEHRARRRGARPRRRRAVRRAGRGPSRPSRATRCSRRGPGWPRTGLPSLADDCGLCVDALNGMPGVLSARWSGRPEDDDAQQPRCCSTSSPTCPTSGAARTSPARSPSCTPGGARARRRAAGWRGRVIRETRGSGGFGYDVLFVADEHPGRTTAELDPAEKDAISHRGRALREIAPQIAEVLV